MTKTKNYWPHGIVLVLIFMVCACVAVVMIAIKNPVEMDSFYMEKYQKVDENINEILAKQKLFDENFELSYKTKKFTIGESNSFELSVKNKKDGTLVQSADIKLMVTRPETNKFNQEIVAKQAKNGIFVFEGIKAEKPGRWQILTKTNIDGKSGFNEYEVYASK
jgi:hypothetical protein